jgi:hypothetical protein
MRFGWFSGNAPSHARTLRWIGMVAGGSTGRLKAPPVHSQEHSPRPRNRSGGSTPGSFMGETARRANHALMVAPAVAVG